MALRGHEMVFRQFVNLKWPLGGTEGKLQLGRDFPGTKSFKFGGVLRAEKVKNRGFV